MLKGSKLTEMMHLVKDGFNKSTVQDCVNYGIKLTKELEEFTRSFLPHMQEEEEVRSVSSVLNTNLIQILSCFHF
jgi:hypothetical protein